MNTAGNTSCRRWGTTCAALLLLAGGCGGGSGSPMATGTAGTGTTGAGAAGAGAAGSGNGAMTGAAGSIASDAGRPDGPADGSAGDASGNAFGGIQGLEDLATVKASAGCGKEPTQPLGSWQMAPVGANKYMFGFALTTPTAKGSLTRRYFVMLPKTYAKDRPHRVVFEAPKCGAVGYEVPAFDAVATSAGGIADGGADAGSGMAADPHGDGVIQVGLTPDPTAYMAGCFDTNAGADTIEKPFVEALWTQIASSFCIDEHRVFFSGYDGGAWLANQVGHVYGSRLFRAISPSAGGLRGAGGVQPCLAAGLPGASTTIGGCLPVPGIWWHDGADTVEPFAGTRAAIEAALLANHCTNATFTAGPKTAYATLQHATCVSYSTCPAAFPVVLCTAVQQDHKNLLEEQVNLAATWAFFKNF